MKDSKNNPCAIKVGPSLLSADFAHLAEECRKIEEAGADSIHLDIMDGHFVPNLTMGAQVVAAVNRCTPLFLDVHLMIYNPYDYIERFVEAGADRITFHFEATEEVEETLLYIRRCNIEAGLAFCPETSSSMVLRYLNQCDLMLLMTVHPGFGGQSFMPEVLEKIRFTRDVCDRLNIRAGGITPEANSPPLPPFAIQVDGGITPETAKECIDAGADVLVAGTYLFQGAGGMKEKIALLKEAGDPTI